MMVELITEYGRLVFLLETEKAPDSSAAFLAAVDAEAYAGGTFTRSVSPYNDHGEPVISVVQAGARDSPAAANHVPHESTLATGLRHLDGAVSLPRLEMGSATGAAFFICIGDQPGLDHGTLRNQDGQGFAAFAQVISGMDVVHRIWNMECGGATDNAYLEGQILSKPVSILSATRLTSQPNGTVEGTLEQ